MKPIKDYLKSAGDCELKSISFEGKGAKINILDPFYDTKLLIEISDVTLLFFFTNHTQNVISGIHYAKKNGRIDDRLGIS